MPLLWCSLGLCPLLLLVLGNCPGGVGVGVDWSLPCPGLFPRVFSGCAPAGNLSAGTYVPAPRSPTLELCVAACCADALCNVALAFNGTCYAVRCVDSESCLPLRRADLPAGNSPDLVLVKPVREDDNWARLLRADSLPETGDGTDAVSLSSGGSTVGAVSSSSASPAGAVGSSSDPPVRRLLVSAVSKEIRLPENEVTLSAYTVPAESPDEPYTYAWSLLSRPDGRTGTIADRDRVTVRLGNLSEGLYAFKVVVTGRHAYGEARANVTVLPAKRINRPPVAVVSPASQIVKLPNTGAVLDGSASTDDDRVVSYRWELLRGPIGYRPDLARSPTLQLSDLVAGNYTFRLTVVDSDGAAGSAGADLVVLPLTDYPPNANAGEDVIVHLPRGELVLNGNLSTDDRGIVGWEWTKGPSDRGGAVDMRDTRTPYLRLSGLEEGIYAFVLRVTDGSGQTSSAEVRVFVKPPADEPPRADAGDDVVVAQPNARAVLNGTRSNDGARIVSYRWTKISGPAGAALAGADGVVARVDLPAAGEYVFRLTVVDDRGNADEDDVRVVVTSGTNAPPRADAGGDRVLVAPVELLAVNGSRSTDDMGIRRWRWTRDPSGLALGTVLPRTDESPVLLLTGVVPGRYVFRLEVEDEQGLRAEDTVSVVVKPDPRHLDLVELILNVEAGAFVQSRKDSLLLRLRMLLRDGALVVVRGLRPEPRTGKLALIFYVRRGGADGDDAVPGPEVVEGLRERLRKDPGLLRLSVASVDTLVCRNECSGHGTCDGETRRCLCEAFWMENLVRRYFGDGRSNCDWSVLYVVLALLSFVLCWIGCAWGLVRCCRRFCAGGRRERRSRKRPPRYSLLGPTDTDVGVGGCGALGRRPAVTFAETDTDSDDVLFEHCHALDDENGSLVGKRRNGFPRPITTDLET